MPRVSLEHEDRVPDFLPSQIEADDSIAMNLDSIHSISTSSSGREIVQETAVYKIKLSSKREKLSSLRALEVNTPGSCKVGNVGASSNILKSVGLLREKSSLGRGELCHLHSAGQRQNFSNSTLRQGKEEKGGEERELHEGVELPEQIPG
ncbi:hypothetical protein AVEN_192243-1 [Araneus ventricosus]|uniref:Uncharacterized protein n=1 Tax=Araneus ventricosus TaxID=182803 RepID=A0A4Y2VKD5_ARAVE|nr:hypothetical protein AVEN_174433-1 [Araneus ventricosus]GBO25022.1 hypothetical protein AVEN_179778-1 [Araneus ventricosus]GBO25063.1 hypothetical protein AVEN_80369-1 [Araneus ventricosus]GBO25083.1 hypothetical protein AVEN_192243-1 [Araneus ventricosus]